MKPLSVPGPLPAALENAVDDSVLVARTLDGDATAFELLIRRHNRLLFRTIRGILASDADAEDALQDAWISAHRSLASFRAEARLSTWLVRVAINSALMRRRRVARDVVVSLRPADDDDDDRAPVDALDDEAPNPEQAHVQAEARKLVEARIDELPDAYRIVFMLRVVEDRSVEETAEVLGIPEATVRSRQFRARAMLRDALARDLDVAVDGAFRFDGERCDRIVTAVFAHIGR
jgi:RNA polymerase sigma-70 factor, ECF subfamily